MKSNIIFVDDEPNILQGLRRMLRPMRDQWDMHFASSGPEALELMSRIPMDAIVSDMRMPGMDGPELLRHVMREHPKVVRFALSGFSDQELVGRSIGPTHQYLNKPCDEKCLVQALERGLKARGFITNPLLYEKLVRIEHLPVLSKALERLSRELAQCEPSLKAIGDIVSEDVGLSANLLKLVNSSYFGLARVVPSPQQAVIVLGVNVIQSVLLSFHLFEVLNGPDEALYSVPKLWKHCMRTASIARALAQEEGLPKAKGDSAYMAALLHDVGKLLLNAQCREESEAILKTVRSQNRRVAEVEAERYGLTHAQVGAYLLGLWGLPWDVVVAIGAHHEDSPDDGDVSNIVHFANLLDHDVHVLNAGFARPRPGPRRLGAIGGEERYARWREVAKNLRFDMEPQ